MTALADKLHVSITVVGVLPQLAARPEAHRVRRHGRAATWCAPPRPASSCTQRSRESIYCGPMPVPLDLYTAVVRHQRPQIELDHDRLAALVLGPGPVRRAARPARPRNPRRRCDVPSTAARHRQVLGRRADHPGYEDVVLVPHCVEVDGQIVSVFDPTLHDAIDEQPRDGPTMGGLPPPLSSPAASCIAGMLDLQLERDSGVYLAPLQMKANNGILVIDDFGRQAMTPTRCSTAGSCHSDRSVDYLTRSAASSRSLELKVVLSTNPTRPSSATRRSSAASTTRSTSGPAPTSSSTGILSGDPGDPPGAPGARSGASPPGRPLPGRRRAAGLPPGVVCRVGQRHLPLREPGTVPTPELVDRVLALYFTEDLGVERTGPAPHHTVDVPPFSPDPEIEAEMAPAERSWPGPGQRCDGVTDDRRAARSGTRGVRCTCRCRRRRRASSSPYPGMFTGSLDPAAATIAEGCWPTASNRVEPGRPRAFRRSADAGSDRDRLQQRVTGRPTSAGELLGSAPRPRGGNPGTRSPLSPVEVQLDDDAGRVVERMGDPVRLTPAWRRASANRSNAAVHVATSVILVSMSNVTMVRRYGRGAATIPGSWDRRRTPGRARRRRSSVRPCRSKVCATVRSGATCGSHCWTSCDARCPSTRMRGCSPIPTPRVGASPVADVPCLSELPALIRLRYATEHARWTGVGDSVVTLVDSTAGRPEQSRLYRELLVDLGVSDVASVVFRDVNGCWAFLDLWRMDGTFDPAETRLLRSGVELHHRRPATVRPPHVR